MFRRNIVQRIVRVMRTGDSSISQERFLFDRAEIEYKERERERENMDEYLTMRDSPSFR